jgi:hypothetical protein
LADWSSSFIEVTSSFEALSSSFEVSSSSIVRLSSPRTLISSVSNSRSMRALSAGRLASAAVTAVRSDGSRSGSSKARRHGDRAIRAARIDRGLDGDRTVVPRRVAHDHTQRGAQPLAGQREQIPGRLAGRMREVVPGRAMEVDDPMPAVDHDRSRREPAGERPLGDLHRV